MLQISLKHYWGTTNLEKALLSGSKNIANSAKALPGEGGTRSILDFVNLAECSW